MSKCVWPHRCVCKDPNDCGVRGGNDAQLRTPTALELEALERDGGIPMSAEEAFRLQHDSGDEQPHRSQDQKARECDALNIPAGSFFEAARSAEAAFNDDLPVTVESLFVTNTPRPGETPEQVAARYRMDVPASAKDCKEYCGDACTCGLNSPPPYKDALEFDSPGDPPPDAASCYCDTMTGHHCEGACAMKAARPMPDGFKENNPKDAFGVLKACMSWVPMPVIMELCLAMAEGGFKYGGHNYMVAAPRASVYTDGAFRHIFQFNYEGDLDEESKVGLHHISKAIASLVVLRAAQLNGHWIDDRPAGQMPHGFLAALNEKMKELAKEFPDPVARYLKDGKRGPGRILES